MDSRHGIIDHWGCCNKQTHMFPNNFWCVGLIKVVVMSGDILKYPRWQAIMPTKCIWPPYWIKSKALKSFQLPQTLSNLHQIHHRLSSDRQVSQNVSDTFFISILPLQCIKFGSNQEVSSYLANLWSTDMKPALDILTWMFPWQLCLAGLLGPPYHCLQLLYIYTQHSISNNSPCPCTGKKKKVLSARFSAHTPALAGLVWSIPACAGFQQCTHALQMRTKPSTPVTHTRVITLKFNCQWIMK